MGGLVKGQFKEQLDPLNFYPPPWDHMTSVTHPTVILRIFFRDVLDISHVQLQIHSPAFLPFFCPRGLTCMG